MPELPRVEKHRKNLERQLAGLVVSEVGITERGGGPRDGLVDEKVLGKAAEVMEEVIKERRVDRVERRGKWMFMCLEKVGKKEGKKGKEKEKVKEENEEVEEKENDKGRKRKRKEEKVEKEETFEGDGDVFLLIHLGMTGSFVYEDGRETQLKLRSKSAKVENFREIEKEEEEKGKKRKRAVKEEKEEKEEKEDDDEEEDEDEEFPPRYTKLLLTFKQPDDNKTPPFRVAFTDPRRLGKVKLQNNPLSTPPLSLLAVDPAVGFGEGGEAFRGEEGKKEFIDKMLKKKSVVKGVLLDQEAVVSGLGNWMVDEICYQAQVHPGTICSHLTVEEIETIHEKIIYVTDTAVGVDSNSYGFPNDWLFHYRWGKGGGEGKGKMPSGEKIVFETWGSRTTAIVPAKQKKKGGAVGRGAGKAKGKAKGTAKETAKGKTKAKGKKKEESESDSDSDFEEEPPKKKIRRTKVR